MFLCTDERDNFLEGEMGMGVIKQNKTKKEENKNVDCI